MQEGMRFLPPVADMTDFPAYSRCYVKRGKVDTTIARRDHIGRPGAKACGT